MSMSISPQELRHVMTGAPPATPSGTAATPALRASGGPVGVVVAPSDPSPAAATGDGPVLVALKQSLAAAGFSSANSTASADDTTAAMHGFTHAFFDSVQAQRQADAAAGHPTGMRGAIRQLSQEAAAGTAPAALQDSFATLQATQAAGSAASQSSLAQVLSGMATAAPDEVMNVGSLVNVAA